MWLLIWITQTKTIKLPLFFQILPNSQTWQSVLHFCYKMLKKIKNFMCTNYMTLNLLNWSENCKNILFSHFWPKSSPKVASSNTKQNPLFLPGIALNSRPSISISIYFLHSFDCIPHAKHIRKPNENKFLFLLFS